MIDEGGDNTVDGEAAIDEAGHLVASIPCDECGYDLRGLLPEGNCPECGHSIGKSIELRRTRFLLTPEQRRWLRNIKWGMRMFVYLPFMIIVGFLLEEIMSASSFLYSGIVFVSLFTAYLLVMTYFISASESVRDRSLMSTAVRWVSRMAIVMMIVIGVCDAFGPSFPWYGLAEGSMVFVWLATLMLHIAHFAWFFHRPVLRRVAIGCNIAMLLLPVVGAFAGSETTASLSLSLCLIVWILAMCMTSIIHFRLEMYT